MASARKLPRVVVRILEATGVKFRWEEHLGRSGSLRAIQGIHSQGTVSVHRANSRRAERPGDDADRRRLLLASTSLCASSSSCSPISAPSKIFPALPTRYPGVDLIIIRENTEGEYVGIEHEVVPGVVESSRSSRKRPPPASRSSPLHTRASKAARRSTPSIKPTS